MQYLVCLRASLFLCFIYFLSASCWFLRNKFFYGRWWPFTNGPTNWRVDVIVNECKNPQFPSQLTRFLSVFVFYHHSSSLTKQHCFEASFKMATECFVFWDVEACFCFKKQPQHSDLSTVFLTESFSRKTWNSVTFRSLFCSKSFRPLAVRCTVLTSFVGNFSMIVYICVYIALFVHVCKNSVCWFYNMSSDKQRCRT